MSVLLTFVIIYFAGFILYASSYSSKMQDISDDEKKLKVPEINAEKVLSRIRRKKESVAFLKKIGWSTIISLFTTHLTIIVLFTKNRLFDLEMALVLAVAFSLLMIIINWLKGAGTIDSNARMHRNTEF